MPLNGFTVGRDVALDIATPAGPIKFSLITKFTAKKEEKDQKIKGLDGIMRPLRFPDGWTGSFELERQDATADNYFAQIEDNYYSGLNEQACTITETITETDGSISQFRFEGVLLKFDDAGDFAGDASVKQKISFMAARRKKVS